MYKQAQAIRPQAAPQGYNPKAEAPGHVVMWHDARSLVAGPVTSWADEAGGAAFSGAGHTPVASATACNGRPGVATFSGTGYLTKTLAALNGKDKCTLVAVVDLVGDGGAYAILFSSNSAQGLVLWDGYYLGGDMRWGNDTSDVRWNTENSSAHVVIATLDRTLANTEARLYIDGVEKADDRLDGNLAGNFPSDPTISLGALTNGANPFTGGAVGLIGLFDTVLDAAAIVRMNGYLAAAWGL